MTSALYLDMNENLSDVSEQEKEKEKLTTKLKKLNKIMESSPGTKEATIAEVEIATNILPAIKELDAIIDKGHKYEFIGKAGSFCPMKSGTGGGILVREKDGKYYAATGSKGFRWREGESIKGANRMDLIDMGYFDKLAQDAIDTINNYGSFEKFASEEPNTMSIDEVLEQSDKMFANKGDYRDPPWDT